jgi:VanZ family protein
VISRFPRQRAQKAALAWAVFLLALTSWPKPPEVPLVSGIPNFDKLIHLTLYGVEAFLVYRAIRWPGRAGFSLWRVLAIMGAMAVWGTADEVHQLWIPGRSVEAADAAADTVGGLVGSLLAATFSRWRGVEDGERGSLAGRFMERLPIRPAGPTARPASGPNDRAL